ncbi:hypothetical protein KKF61_05375 [Patescibacteria group bacterium]|nr:hypothetical protein [Patescibacteria group bacterium]MBU0964416.1 hypothetical protein [Patescibacteria group bacterium]
MVRLIPSEQGQDSLQLVLSSDFRREVMSIARDQIEFKYDSGVKDYPILAQELTGYVVYCRDWEQKMKKFPFALMD